MQNPLQCSVANGFHCVCLFLTCTIFSGATNNKYYIRQKWIVNVSSISVRNITLIERRKKKNATVTAAPKVATVKRKIWILFSKGKQWHLLIMSISMSFDCVLFVRVFESCWRNIFRRETKINFAFNRCQIESHIAQFRWKFTAYKFCMCRTISVHLFWGLLFSILLLLFSLSLFRVISISLYYWWAEFVSCSNRVYFLFDSMQF